MEIKLQKDTEIIGVKHKKGDIVKLPDSTAEKYIKAKLGKPFNADIPKDDEPVEVHPGTGSLETVSS